MQEKDIKLLSEATKYFGRLAYTQSPKSEIESDYECIGANSEDREMNPNSKLFPLNFVKEEASNLFNFLYKEKNQEEAKVGVVSTTVIQVMTGVVYVNANNSLNKDSLFSVEIKLSDLKDCDGLESALRGVYSKIRDKVLGPLGGIRAKEEPKKPKKKSGFNLRPVNIPDDRPPMFLPDRDRDFNNPRPNIGHNDIFPTGLDPFGRGGDPMRGAGNLMGPEHPFFQRKKERNIRTDPIFPFGNPGNNPFGPGSGGGGMFLG